MEGAINAVPYIRIRDNEMRGMEIRRKILNALILSHHYGAGTFALLNTLYLKKALTLFYLNFTVKLFS
ncbi:hypothetical protein [Caldivirga maquilingensis]|uniref:hypothetical protein n=1 Tax=Caldivirga maquilingensis TaxID=76887 RepID=UPI0012EAD5F1|nr:hypothetical protein [Caldivirga maquilingensis]